MSDWPPDRTLQWLYDRVVQMRREYDLVCAAADTTQEARRLRREFVGLYRALRDRGMRRTAREVANIWRLDCAHLPAPQHARDQSQPGGKSRNEGSADGWLFRCSGKSPSQCVGVWPAQAPKRSTRTRSTIDAGAICDFFVESFLACRELLTFRESCTAPFVPGEIKPAERSLRNRRSQSDHARW